MFKVTGRQLDDITSYGRYDQTKNEYQDSWSAYHTRIHMSLILGAIKLDC